MRLDVVQLNLTLKAISLTI